VIELMVVSMSQAVDPDGLPADVKQWLFESWRVVPDARPYDVRAIQTLTPDRAASLFNLHVNTFARSHDLPCTN
jgi:hypothetical protein